MRPSGPVAERRLGLLVFGAVFLVLFLVLAITEGIGDPSIPDGDVILVQDVPGDGGEISKAEFGHVLFLAATEKGLAQAPKPGDPQYEKMKEEALTNLLEAAWIEGQAAEMGISVSDSAVAKETDKLFKESYPTEDERVRYLVESNLTHEDLEGQVRVHTLSSKIQEQLEEDPSVPSKDEVEGYYDAAKDSEYTQEEKRESRALTFKDKSQAEEAKAELEKDDSTASWKKVGAESDNPVAKKTGGLVNDSAEGEGTAPEPLHAALFAAPQGQVEGPLGTDAGYDVYEVIAITPEKVTSLDEAESQVKARLSHQLQQQAFAVFLADYFSKWTSRTFCSEGFVIEKCANFKGTGHPEGAPAACYEADPKTVSEDCPAPVTPISPAMPGTVTLASPMGDQRAQRPIPEPMSKELREFIPSEAPVSGEGE